MKSCPTYPGYSVTEDGRVFTHRRRFGKGKGHGGGVVIDNTYCKELKKTVGHGDYLYVAISTTRGQRNIPLHRLLLDAFVGPMPKGCETRHLDGNRRNNALSNLCYGTRQENVSDRTKHGSLAGTNHPKAIINEAIVRQIRELSLSMTIAGVVKTVKCSRNIVNGVLSGRTWNRI